MADSYYGELNFVMEKSKADLLKAWIYKYASYSTIKEDNNNYIFTVDEPLRKEFWLVDDFCTFINKYGFKINGKIMVESDCAIYYREYLVENDHIWLTNHYYDDEHKESIKISQLASELKKIDKVNNIRLDNFTSDIPDRIMNLDFNENNILEILKELMVEMESYKKSVFKLWIPGYYYEIGNNNIYSSKLKKGELEEVGLEVKYAGKSYSSILNHPFEVEEKRRIKLDGVFVPLHEEFMDKFIYIYNEDDENVLLESGRYVTVCDVCKNRYKKQLNKECNPCKPLRL